MWRPRGPRVLPIQYFTGLQAVCVKPTHGGAFRHAWVPAGDTEAAAATTTWAHAANASGENVYFSIAAFHPGREYTTWAGRQQANVLALSVLVMDLDYAKHGKDLAWALGLTDALPALFNIPAPTLVVDTGGGVHGYWHLDQPLPVEVWTPLAQRFAGVFRQVNAHVGKVIDTQCTVDSARVLRVPGFHNHKYPHTPLVAEVRRTGGLIPVGVMQAAVAHMPVGQTAPHLRAAAGFAAPAATTPAGLTSAFAGITVSEPADWAQIRDKSLIGLGCEVLREVLADNDKAGYEVWAGLLSVIAHTDGGDAALLAVSERHKDFGVSVHLQDCRNKASSFHSPRTCAQFAEHMPEACRRCPNAGKIKSPIMLGRGGLRLEVAAPAEVPPATEQVTPPLGIVAPQVEGVAEGPEPSPELADVWPPVDKMFRYRAGTGEVEMRQDTDTPGVVAYGVICNRPIWLEYTVEDRVCLGVYDRGAKRHLREFEGARLLAGTDWGPLVAWLTPRGVHPMFTTSRFAPAQHPLIMFIKSLLHRYGAERGLTEVEHFGPSTEVQPKDFVLGPVRYHTDGRPPEAIRIPEGSLLMEHAEGMRPLPEDAALQAAQEFGQRMAPVYAGEEWALDRFILASALGASLSPFLVPREMQGGVIVVSSPESGEAKSSTLMTAAALYTNNPNTLKRSNATHTAVFKVLLPRLNAIPLFLDDWDKQIRGTKAEDVASALTDLLVQSTNLRPKALANGEVTPGWWSTWLYLATNSDVASLVARTETGGAAAGMRFLEVPIPTRQHITPERQAAYEGFRQWRETHGGQTAHVFLRTVLPHTPYLRERYAHWTQRIQTAQPNLGAMAARFLRAMVACTMVGVEASAQMGLLPFDVEELFGVGCRLIARQIQSTEAQTLDQDNIIGAYLAANLSRVVHLDAPTKSLLSSAPEMAAAVGKDDTVYLPTSALSDWLRRTGRSPSHLAARLKRTHPEMRLDTCAIPVAGLTLALKCYVVQVPGIASCVELAHMATPTATSRSRPVH